MILQVVAICPFWVSYQETGLVLITQMGLYLEIQLFQTKENKQQYLKAKLQCLSCLKAVPELHGNPSLSWCQQGGVG